VAVRANFHGRRGTIYDVSTDTVKESQFLDDNVKRYKLKLPATRCGEASDLSGKLFMCGSLVYTAARSGRYVYCSIEGARILLNDLYPDTLRYRG